MFSQTIEQSNNYIAELILNKKGDVETPPELNDCLPATVVMDGLEPS